METSEEKKALEQKENELMLLLTEIYGAGVVGGRSKIQILHEIGGILVARKFFGPSGDTIHSRINQTLDMYIKTIPINTGN